jgi:hypothetical protein
MFTWPLFPRLPEAREDRFADRLVTRLRELFTEFAKVGRQTQCPPTLRRTKSGAQTISGTGATKVTFETAGWDTHGYWDATNSRYTPLDFTGYYRISAKLSFEPQVVTTGNRRCAIYVNNAEYSSVTVPQTTSLRVVVLTTDLVLLNGATDYVEIFAICGEACVIEAESYRTSLAIEYVGADQLP